MIYALVHVPGLDWDLLQREIDAGRAPHIAALIEQGAAGRLYNDGPLGDPVPALGLATGTPPWSHDILAPLRFEGPEGGPRPLDAGDLTRASVWHLAAAAGIPAAALGWPLTHGAAHGPELLQVSDRFARASGRNLGEWAFDPASVSDPAARAPLATLRMHPTELDAATLAHFLPALEQIDRETDPRLGRLALTLARAISLHSAADWVAGNWQSGAKTRLIALHLDLIDDLSAQFLRYAPPRQPQITETDQRLYGQVVTAAYGFLDLLLGQYRALVGEAGSVILASSHGMHSGDERPPPPSGIEGGHGAWAPRLRGRFGVFAAAGPMVPRDRLLLGARSLDLAPTLLALMGLQAPPEMTGRVLEDGIGSVPPAARPAPRPTMAAPERAPLSPAQAAAEIGFLQAAGQCPQLPQDRDLAQDALAALRHRRLAAAFGAAGRPAEAIAQTQALLARHPGDGAALLFLAETALGHGDPDLAATALDEAERLAPSDEGRIPILRARLAAGGPGEEAAFAAAREAANSAQLQRLLGQIALGAGRLAEAEDLFRASLDQPGAAQSASALHGLGAALLRQGQHGAALAALTRAAGQQFWSPQTHFFIALAALRQGDGAQATEALRHCLKMAPDHSGARRLQARLDAAQAEATLAQAARKREEAP